MRYVALSRRNVRDFIRDGPNTLGSKDSSSRRTNLQALLSQTPMTDSFSWYDLARRDVFVVDSSNCEAYLTPNCDIVGIGVITPFRDVLG
jgi:hypothetical protein